MIAAYLWVRGYLCIILVFPSRISSSTIFSYTELTYNLSTLTIFYIKPYPQPPRRVRLMKYPSPKTALTKDSLNLRVGARPFEQTKNYRDMEFVTHTPYEKTFF